MAPTLARVLAALPLAVLATAQASPCPEVRTQPNFDLMTYISKPWYSQQQMPLKYLPVEQFFCVRAEYAMLPTPSFWGYTIQVHNMAYERDGTVHDSHTKICAKGTNSSDPARLEVGLCVLPRISGFTTGAYWVLHYDEEEGYALVSGGQPTIQAAGGCRTGSRTNNAGLWILTRKQERDNALVEKVRGLAAAQGFDLSVLNDVDQSSCPPSPHSNSDVLV